MRITIELPDDLFQKARKAALERRTTLKLLIVNALNRELDVFTPEARHMMQPPVGLDLVPTMKLCANAELAALLNEEEVCAPFWMLLWQRNGMENSCKSAI